MVELQLRHSSDFFHEDTEFHVSGAEMNEAQYSGITPLHRLIKLHKSYYEADFSSIF